MDINLPNASLNLYQGIKVISDILDECENNDIDHEEAIELIQESMIKNQPLLAAYCVACELNGKDVTTPGGE